MKTILTSLNPQNEHVNLAVPLEDCHVRALTRMAASKPFDRQGRPDVGGLIRTIVSEHLYQFGGETYRQEITQWCTAFERKREQAERRLRRMKTKKAATRKLN